MSSVQICIDEELFESARRTAAAEFRTVPAQIAFWAKIGRAALDNPDLPVDFIKDILAAKQLGEREPFVFADDEGAFLLSRKQPT